jgi:hypothetical protein
MVLDGVPVMNIALWRCREGTFLRILRKQFELPAIATVKREVNFHGRPLQIHELGNARRHGDWRVIFIRFSIMTEMR